MIAIIGAMEEETTALKEQMEDPVITKRAGRTFYRGKLKGTDTVVVTAGVGKVNAASCAQQIIDLFAPQAIVNTGIAGALAPGLRVGDIVISRDAVQHDVDTTVFGDAPGQIPDMEVYEFPADPLLMQAAREAGEAAEAESDFHGKVHEGRVLSGDVFLSDFDRKQTLYETFNGACVEMEGAAIGQVAWLNGTPWVILRCISDQADNPVVTDYLEFKKEAIRISVKVVLMMLDKLGSMPCARREMS